MVFQNKTIVVTGAGGGVGRQLVLQLLRKGARVAAVDINKAALEETKLCGGQLASKVSVHIADITDQERVARLPKEVLDAHSRVDGIINNAGIIQPFTTFAELDDASCQRLMNINFYGMLRMTRAFIPYLAASPEACIGNVSSMGGFLPVPGQSLYGASKAAVKIATEGLRMELADTPIRVSLIIPGGIATDIKKNSGLGEDGASEKAKANAGLKLVSPEKAADAIISGLERNKAKVLIGMDAKLMDILYRIMPRNAGNIIKKVMAANHGGIMNQTEALLAHREAV